MSDHVLLNLLKELRNRFFRKEFNKFNNTGAGMLDFIKLLQNRILTCQCQDFAIF